VVFFPSHFFLRAVFAAFLNALAVGAPFVFGFLMRSLLPPLIRLRFACMFLYKLILPFLTGPKTGF